MPTRHKRRTEEAIKADATEFAEEPPRSFFQEALSSTQPVPYHVEP